MTLDVAVVICTYSTDRWDALTDAIEGARRQEYQGAVQVVVVVDGNDELCELVSDTYRDEDDVTIHCNEENVGVSTSRNNGVRALERDVDVVAFLDDDAVPDPNWIAELVDTYESTDAVAVGGRMVAEWETTEPDYLPEEFYWLIGVTHPGFAEPGEEVRNTFASNISFRFDVFQELDGFADQIGRKDDANLQAEEPEIGARLQKRYGRGVVYNPDAVAAHRIFDYRTDYGWILDRAFWQGYSKRAIDALTEDAANDAESAFIHQLVMNAVPTRVKQSVFERSLTPAKQLVWLVILTATVGIGYLYGFTKYR